MEGEMGRFKTYDLDDMVSCCNILYYYLSMLYIVYIN